MADISKMKTYRKFSPEMNHRTEDKAKEPNVRKDNNS